MRKYTDTRSETVDRTKDANRKLRSEIAKLKRENKQLRKLLDRAENTLNELSSEDDTLFPVEKDVNTEEQKTKCNKCKQVEVTHFSAGIYKIHICQNCRHSYRSQVVRGEYD